VLGTTPDQTKGEKARDDDLTKRGISQKSYTASALVYILILVILLLFLHQYLVCGDYDEGGPGFSLTLIV